MNTSERKMEEAKHLVDQGIEALLTGERARARELLQKALKQDPRNERGWLALSFAVDKPEHALECVQRVLALNPGHEKAQERLADLQVSTGNPTAPQAQPVVQPPVLQNLAEPARWVTESDALQATGEYFYFEPAAERYVRGETSTLPTGREGCILLFLIPFVLAGLVILGLSVREWVRTIALMTESAETWGTLVDREKDDSGDSTNYYVTYRFVVDDRMYVIDESVGSGIFNSVDEGEPLRVRYALHNPNIASIERVGVLRVHPICLRG